MKFTKRIISLMFALLLTVSAFVACDSSSNKEDTTAQKTEGATVTETETETEFFPDVEKKDYGADFHLVIQPQSNKASYYT